VNYLAHAWVLRERTPGLVLGASLPDLLGAWDRRSPRIVAPRFEDEGEHELARGIRAHHAADASFHALPAFGESCAAIRGRLEDMKKGGRVRLFFVAHVLLEMLLDAAIVEREPSFGAVYYEALAAAPVGRVAAVLGLEGDFESFLRRFVGSRFLLDYATDEGVARRLEQVLSRGRQALGRDGPRVLMTELPRLRTLVRERFDDLTLEPIAAAGAVKERKAATEGTERTETT
jgi:hypothetical protein